MKKLEIGASTLAALGVFGLMGALSAAAPQDQNMNSNMNSNMSHNYNKSMMAGLNSTDQKFMMMAAQGGMAEVEMARAALQHAGSDSVKSYAQQMIDDHTKANQELMSIAASKGVTLPTGPDAKHQAMMSKMAGMSGAAFDREYLKNAGVKDHEKMEKLFMNEGAKGMDADTKAFAAKTLPTVQMHLRMAREAMSGMMGNGGGSHSGGMNDNMGGMDSGMGGSMNSNMGGMNSNSNSNMGGKKAGSKNANSNKGGNMNSNMGSNMNSNNSNMNSNNSNM